MKDWELQAEFDNGVEEERERILEVIDKVWAKYYGNKDSNDIFDAITRFKDEIKKEIS